MQHEGTTTDREIAAIAARAHGIVTRTELLGGGLTAEEIRTRMKRGSLLSVFAGVYRVGHIAPSVEASYMAAVKACGDEATLCGAAAAHLLGLIRGAPPAAWVAAPGKKRVKGVRTRRLQLEPNERTIWSRIPITTPARTLADLAAGLPEDTLGRAVHEAQVRHKTTPAQIEAVLIKHPNIPGASKLRRIASGDAPTVLSKLEAQFLKVLAANRLPLPKTNRRVDGRYVDCRWPGLRLTVELDSFGCHNSRHSWERDRRREREAYARGDEFRRYTYGDVCEQPRAMLVELRSVLRARATGH